MVCVLWWYRVGLPLDIRGDILSINNQQAVHSTCLFVLVLVVLVIDILSAQ